MSVLLETSAGDLVIDLLTEEAPKACLNFLKLCKCKYYNFAPIYNLQVPSFFQAGDPLFPAGTGGQSCWGLSDPSKTFFKPEISRRQHERGSISMVCSDDGLCASQFFLCLQPNEAFDKKHAIFGRLAEGEDTLEKIARQPVDNDYRPLRDIRIKHTIVLEDPFDDPEGFVGEPPESPLPSAIQLSTMRIDMDDTLEENDSTDDLEAKRRAREAEASALTLETLGDLPFASIRPPENILFVCKLNPVTSSEDLELIFGRFGRILSCQVVRDKRSGDSLQYAFIEFDVKEDAERAYFKMQGVLIDDRRIHVDFSQSVAKLPAGRSTDSSYGRSGGRSHRPSTGRGARSDRHGGTAKYEMVFDRDEDRERSKAYSAGRSEELYGSRRHDDRSRDHKRYRSRSPVSDHRRERRRNRTPDRRR